MKTAGKSHNKQFGADARTVFENVVRHAFYTISKVRCFQIPSSRLAFPPAIAARVASGNPGTEAR